MCTGGCAHWDEIRPQLPLAGLPRGRTATETLQGVPSLGVARYAFSRAMEQFDETAQRKLAAHYKALVVQVPLRRYATVPRPSACHAAACALPPITDFEFAFGGWGWGGFPLGPT